MTGIPGTEWLAVAAVAAVIVTAVALLIGAPMHRQLNDQPASAAYTPLPAPDLAWSSFDGLTGYGVLRATWNIPPTTKDRT
jgi:hypothetical protein